MEEKSLLAVEVEMGWLIGIGARVTLLFVAAQAVVLGGMRLAHTDDYPDPFSPYEAVIVGAPTQPGEIPCRIQTEDNYIEATVCRLYPADGVFTSITSTAYDYRFLYTVFLANDLKIGDIIRHWGRPDRVRPLGPYFMVIWEDRGLYGRISPAVISERFDYMLPVANFIVASRSTIP